MSLKKMCFGTLGLSVPVVNRICENPSQAKPPFSEHSRATEHVCVYLHYRAVCKAVRLCRGSPNRHQPIWRGDIFYHRCKFRLMEIYVSHTQKVLLAYRRLNKVLNLVYDFPIISALVKHIIFILCTIWFDIHSPVTYSKYHFYFVTHDGNKDLSTLLSRFVCQGLWKNISMQHFYLPLLFSLTSACVPTIQLIRHSLLVTGINTKAIRSCLLRMAVKYFHMDALRRLTPGSHMNFSDLYSA